MEFLPGDQLQGCLTIGGFQDLKGGKPAQDGG
jgi:hypothetical protein